MIISFCKTVLASMLPFVELRIGIPLGYFYYDLPIWVATFAGTLGTMVAVAIFFYFLPKIERYLEKFPKFKRTIDEVFYKTRKEHSRKFIVLGGVFLIMFIAIPFPGSGGWSGAILAFLFNIPRKEALKFMFFGLTLAGLIMGFLTLNTDLIIEFFNSI